MKFASWTLTCFIATAFAKPQWNTYSQEDALYQSQFSEESFLPLSDLQDSDEIPLADGDTWQNQALQQQNQLRAQNRFNPFQLDQTLSNDAQKIADRLAGNCQTELKSSREDGIVSMAAAPALKAGASAYENVNRGIQQWADEAKNYDCGRVSLADVFNPNSVRGTYYKTVADYMNMMNSMNTKVGYGYAENKSCDKGITVARYGGRSMDMINVLRNSLARTTLMNINVADPKIVPCPNRTTG